MSIADRITSMSNNLSSAYDGIEYLGVDTTGVDKNLQNLSSMLNVVYEGLPKVSDEGVSPSIDGSRVGRLKSTLKASDTTQGSTTGKSLVDFFNIDYKLLNNGTASFSNGEITVNSNTSAYGGLKFLHTELNLQPNTQYTFSATIKSTTAVEGSRISCNKLNTAGSIKYSDPATSGRVSITFTTPDDISGFDDTCALGLYPYGSNQTAVYTDLMLALGTDDTYEPYTGRIPAPNPSFPQDIHVVKGNNTVFVGSKNLLPPLTSGTSRDVTVSQSGSTVTVDGTSSGATSGLGRSEFTLQPGTYRFVAKYKSGTIDNVMQVLIKRVGTNSDVAGLRFESSDYTESKISAITISEPTDVYIIVYIGNSGRTYDNFKFDVQLVKGTSADYDFANPMDKYPINLPVQNLFDKSNADIKNWLIGNTNHNIDTSSVNERSIVVSVKPNTTYTISKMVTNRFRIGESSQYPQAGDILNNYVRDENGGTSITITTLSTTNYLVINIINVSNTAYNLQDTLDSVQIEPGNKANRYTPYGVAPIELCKINTYQDKLFKAVSGDTVYDSLTSEQKAGLTSGGWYKYAEVGKYKLTGREKLNNNTSAWRTSTTTDMDRFICDRTTATTFLTSSYSLCNYFTTVPGSAYYAVGTWRNNADGQLVFNFSEYGTTTLEQFLAWVSTHDVILYQPYPTPQIVPITDTTLISQLENLYSAMSKNGQTNILQTNADLPFTIFASALKGE